MGYINERVPKEEVRTYMIPGYKEIKPFSWTIDREKDIKFFEYWTNIDNPSENYYALVFGEYVTKVILNKTVIVNTVTWNLESLCIPEDCNLSQDEVLEELRNALKEYGLFGYELSGKTEVETIVAF